MEPIGLAVGAVGLVGLFSSCLDAVEKVQSYRAFGTDSQDLHVQFKAERLRLEQWGRDVGFVQERLSIDDRLGSLSMNHHPALDDPETAATARELLLIIKRICSTTSDDAVRQPLTSNPSRHAPSESKRRRVTWALWGKGDRTEQVKLFGRVVQQLHNLVAPGPGSTSVQAVEEIWSVEVRQMISRLDDEIRGETRREVHSWLLGPHLRSELYDSSVQKRVQGTCNWILNRPAFVNWMSRDSSPPGTPEMLWIHGPAGFGKTMLCAWVVEHLSSTLETPVAHFFFSTDFESGSDPFVAIRSWVSQIATRHTAAFDLVHERWGAEYDQVATRGTVVPLFRALLQTVPGCTLVTDGLDECDSMSDSSVSVDSFIETVKQAIAGTATRVMIVSRDESEIRQALMDSKAERCAEYKISLEDVREDTESYSRSIVDKKLSNKSQDIKTDISDRMAERCEGQFLWLKLQEDGLRKGLNRKQLQKAIAETPMGLERLYQRNWERITGFRERERARAITLLRWAAFALRPLTVCEITEAVLIDGDADDGNSDNSFPVDELPDSIDEDYVDSEILGLCGSLLEIRGAPSEASIGSRTVHLTHFSVKQYLLRTMAPRGGLVMANEGLRTSNEVYEHSLLARACLLYIDFRKVWQDKSEEQAESPELWFKDYAAGYWARHAKPALSDDAELLMLTTKFLNQANASWDGWRRWYESNYARRTSEDIAMESIPPNPLYFASSLGLTEIVKFLATKHPHFVNESNSSGRSALGIACRNGHIAVVKALLDAGTDVTAESHHGAPALYWASSRGRSELVSLLLENGADVSATNDDGWFPLCIAAYKGHIEIVRTLLENGADIATPVREGATALHFAAFGTNADVMNILLDNGADITTVDEDGWTALHRAALHSVFEMVQLLLERGADVNVKDRLGQTALFKASYQGHARTVELLLEKRADLTIKDRVGQTALFMASGNGHTEVVRLLLEKGADAAVDTGNGRGLLHAASRDGYNEVAQLLPEKGSNVNAVDERGATPLHFASQNGRVEVVRLLLDHRADINVEYYRGLTPLHIASQNGHTDVVGLLLEKGCDAMATNKSGWTALHYSSMYGHKEVVKLLLARHDIEASHQDNHGRTALFVAARYGDEEVVQLLLAMGCFVPLAKDFYGATPLFAATRNGHVKTMELLFDIADLNSRDSFGHTLIWWARRTGNREAVQFLLSRAKEAGVKILDEDPSTASRMVSFDPKMPWCDACSLTIPDSSERYKCETCYGGNFDICMECVADGIKCRNASHPLVVQAGRSQRQR